MLEGNFQKKAIKRFSMIFPNSKNSLSADMPKYHKLSQIQDL